MGYAYMNRPCSCPPQPPQPFRTQVSMSQPSAQQTSMTQSCPPQASMTQVSTPQTSMTQVSAPQTSMTQASVPQTSTTQPSAQRPQTSVSANSFGFYCPNTAPGGMEQYPVGMGYVPWQQWQQTYPLEQGFNRGTIFPDLDLPFMMGRCIR